MNGAINGAILENYVVSEIIKTYSNSAQDCLLHYYRDKNSNEIDLIMESDGQLHPIEIKKSINSQILTVFAAPLLASGVHLCFAFPLIRKLLMMFGLSNTPLLVGVTVGSYLVFAVLYVVMYKATSRSYYQLVK